MNGDVKIIIMEKEELPCSDYEPCGECGYDHGYEQQEAYDWHTKKAEE